VAERVARDLDAERGEPVLLLGEEARVVADDRVHRHGRSIARADVGAHRETHRHVQEYRRKRDFAKTPDPALMDTLAKESTPSRPAHTEPPERR
jgi:phosphopentomutase